MKLDYSNYFDSVNKDDMKHAGERIVLEQMQIF